MSKLTQIQNELKAKKSCYNSFGKYHYRKCEDILEALKPLLAKHEVIMAISDEVKCVGDYTFIESTVSLSYESKAYHTSAQAGIEKAGGMALPQAFGAASSYARKYALGAMFLLDDTEDADATNDHGKGEVLKPADAITKVGEVSDLNALTAYWKELPKKMQEHSEVKAAFTAKKTLLTPTDK